MNRPLTLYGFDHSPFFAAAKGALTSLTIPFEEKQIQAWDRREILRLTGGTYYQISLIVDGDRVIIESSDHSQDIASYINSKTTGSPLFPMENEGLHDVVLRYIEETVEPVTTRLADPAYHESIEDPIGRGLFRRHKERKFGRGCLEAWARERQTILQECATVLEPLEKQLAGGPYLFGDAPVYADFLLFGILSNMTFQGTSALPEPLEGFADFSGRLEAFRYRDSGAA